MGANSTQARGVALFFIGFILISGGLAANIGYLYLLIGLLLVGASFALFAKCKPWEHKED